MKIALIGAGAIGSLVAGYLKLKDMDVCLVGRPDSVKAIRENGLNVSGVRGNFVINLPVSEKLTDQSELVILATKTQDIDTVIKDNLTFLKDSTLLTTQNGTEADALVAQYLPQANIISSIVMFGSTYLEPGKVVHNFEGNWILSATNRGGPANIYGGGRKEEEFTEIVKALDKAFPVVLTDDIKGMKYLKIFLNANNCLAAILGKSMQEAFLDLEISRISIAIWKEGLDIATKAGIKLVSLPDFPLERLIKLISMPIDEAAKVYSQIMVNLSKEPLFGSILQSIKRGRASEIDYINGEFVSLAKKYNLAAPLNKKLVKMVHKVEKTNKFLSKERLLEDTAGLIN